MSDNEANRAVIADFVMLFYERRDPVAALEKHAAPEYIQHNPRIADGRDAACAFLAPLFAGPGKEFSVKRVLVDGDLAAIHLHGRPDPATPGVAVVDLYRLEGGKIVEHWDVMQPVTPSEVNPHPFF